MNTILKKGVRCRIFVKYKIIIGLNLESNIFHIESSVIHSSKSSKSESRVIYKKLIIYIIIQDIFNLNVTKVFLNHNFKI
jgi:hypothetical protein